ncbi:hypothetical protein JTE90_015171 [Oedothorax gibbosus]|uniref:PWWP domain-containing protein n=1 Tax=Oedothorax gibbosus TaxID=931172 RepID=A0AAV6VA69_9ARAC|nr:hypothetical protein JTE90_015171 [Oedothorax gibbosus]
MEEMGPTKRNFRAKRKASTKVLRPRIKRKQKVEVASLNKRKKIEVAQNIEEKPGDTYCWLCHKICQDRTCGCKRVYHKRCLEKMSLAFKYNKCPECQVKTEKRPDLSRPFTRGLKVYLESAVQLITDKHKTKRLSWSQNTDLIGSINIETLLKKVQDGVYKTTAEFFSDVKWLYHNSCILNGENSKQTKDINKAINDFKEELYDMEACPECYYHLNVMEGNDSDIENSFARLCDPPHDIVWARVHGHPFWPAKLLKVTNGKARVRFFGKHEKADVAIHTIFYISVSHPSHTSKDIKAGDAHTSLDYAFAKEELLAYIRIYERNIGKFLFCGRRVLYASINDSSRELIKTQNLTNKACLTKNTNENVMSINSPAFGRFLPSRSMSNFPSESFERDNLSANRDVLSDTSFCMDSPSFENISSDIGNYASTSSRVVISGLQNVGNTMDPNTPSRNSSFQDTSSNPTSSCMSPCSTTSFRSIKIKEENCDLDEPHRISSVYSTSSLSGDLLQLLFQGVTVAEPEQVVEEVVVKEEILESDPPNNELEGNEYRSAGVSTNDISNLMESLITSVSSESTDNYIQERRINGTEGEGNAASNENFTTRIPSIVVHQPENRSDINSTEVLDHFNCGIDQTDRVSNNVAQESLHNVSVALPSSSKITEIDLTGDDDNGNSSMSLSNLFVKNPKMQQVLANTQKQLGHFLTTRKNSKSKLVRSEINLNTFRKNLMQRNKICDGIYNFLNIKV